jgi:homoserine O-succinyltransferase
MTLYTDLNARTGPSDLETETRRRRPLKIGLVNNMPDAALAGTEAQFRGLLAAAVGPRGFDLKLYTLAGATRAPAVRKRLARTHGTLVDLMAADLDGVIVTGAEPKAGRVDQEPLYKELAALAAHSEARAATTVWSCLAAHAAIFHLIGASRRPLGAKLAGVFPFERADPHALTNGADLPLSPHSRMNELCEGELRAGGCAILTRSAAHGVDAFVLERGGLFVFLQGHPEYDPDALRLEWRRDIRRALAAGGPPPPPPCGYFSLEGEAMLRAAALEGPTALLVAARSAPLRALLWRPWAEQFWRNWCALLTERLQASEGPERIKSSKA